MVNFRKLVTKIVYHRPAIRPRVCQSVPSIPIGMANFHLNRYNPTPIIQTLFSYILPSSLSEE